MKRRKAIRNILLAGGGLVVAGGAYEWYSIKRKPDLELLLSKKALLVDIADTILPATDTPGARDAGAIDFLLPILTVCPSRETLNRFLDGLSALESHTRSLYNREFRACTEEERIAVLEYFEDLELRSDRLTGRIEKHFLGQEFIRTMKQYTVESYCISEKGATLGLAYVPVPGKYLACIPLEPNQRSWATN